MTLLFEKMNVLISVRVFRSILIFILACLLGGVFGGLIAYSSDYRLHADKLIPHSQLITETDIAKVYILDSEISKKVKRVDSSSVYRLPNTTFFLEHKEMINIQLKEIQSFLTELGINQTFNVFYIPGAFQEHREGVYTEAFVPDIKGNKNIFVSLQKDPDGSSLAHEVGHLIWYNHIKGTPFEKQYYSIRALDESFFSLDAWEYNHEEVFAEDVAVYFSGKINTTAAGNMSLQQQEGFIRMLKALSNK